MMSDSHSPPEALQGFPPAVHAAYARYAQEGSGDAAIAVVLPAFAFLAGREEAPPLSDYPDETRLDEDLEIDSLATAELVFLIERLFEVQVTDEELQTARTIGGLKALVRAKAEGQ